MPNKTTVLICLTAILCVLIGVIGWVVATNHNAETIIGWAGITIGPLIGVLMTFLRADQTKAITADIQSTVADMQSNVQDVKDELTNGGTITQLTHEIQILRNQLNPPTKTT